MSPQDGSCQKLRNYVLKLCRKNSGLFFSRVYKIIKMTWMYLVWVKQSKFNCLLDQFTKCSDSSPVKWQSYWQKQNQLNTATMLTIELSPLVKKEWKQQSSDYACMIWPGMLTILVKTIVNTNSNTYYFSKKSIANTNINTAVEKYWPYQYFSDNTFQYLSLLHTENWYLSDDARVL